MRGFGSSYQFFSKKTFSRRFAAFIPICISNFHFKGEAKARLVFFKKKFFFFHDWGTLTREGFVFQVNFSMMCLGFFTVPSAIHRFIFFFFNLCARRALPSNFVLSLSLFFTQHPHHVSRASSPSILWFDRQGGGCYPPQSVGVPPSQAPPFFEDACAHIS